MSVPDAYYTEGSAWALIPTDGSFPGRFLTAGTSSFTDFLTAAAPSCCRGSTRRRRASCRRAGRPPARWRADLPHGTTIVAAACDGGVVMAGDRRATAGQHDRRSATSRRCSAATSSPRIGIAGVAGIGIDLVRLFQVELEHYEKIEGRTLSLEGKANRLAAHGPRQPRRRDAGPGGGAAVRRLRRGHAASAGSSATTSPAAGTRSSRFHSIGSGSVFARGALKKLYRDGMPAEDAVLACMQALYDAADDDSATGGPDLTRRIYPVWRPSPPTASSGCPTRQAGEYAQAVVDGPDAAPDGPLAPLSLPSGSPGALAAPPSQPAPCRPAHPTSSSKESASGVDAVLRLARAGDEGQGGLRAQGHHAWPQRRRDRPTTPGSCSSRRTRPARCSKFSEIYDRIAFAAVGRYNEFENLRKAGVRYADLTGYQYDRQDVTARGLANWYAQVLGTIFTESNKPLRGRDRRRRGRRSTEDDDQIYRITFDGSVTDEHGYVVMGGQADQVADGAQGALLRRHDAGRGACSVAIAALAGPGATAGAAERTEITAAQLEVAMLDRTRSHRTFRRLTGARLEALLAEAIPARTTEAIAEGTGRPPARRAARLRRAEADERLRRHAASRASGAGGTGGQADPGPAAPTD